MHQIELTWRRLSQTNVHNFHLNWWQRIYNNKQEDNHIYMTHIVSLKTFKNTKRGVRTLYWVYESKLTIFDEIKKFWASNDPVLIILIQHTVHMPDRNFKTISTHRQLTNITVVSYSGSIKFVLEERMDIWGTRLQDTKRLIEWLLT